MVYHVMFSEALQELNKEVTRHSKLVEIIRPVSQNDAAEMIGHVAAFCGIVLDGFYTEKEMEKLYKILLERLRKKRIIVIVDDSKKVH